MPSRHGSSGSANMTWVLNSSRSSLMMVWPTSTGTMLPSAVSDGEAISLPTFFGDGGRKRAIYGGTRPHAFAVPEAALRVLVVGSSCRWSAGFRWFRSSASLPAG